MSGQKWIEHTIEANAAGDIHLALDINFMGKNFRVDKPQAVRLSSDELCIDVAAGQSRTLKVWIESDK